VVNEDGAVSSRVLVSYSMVEIGIGAWKGYWVLLRSGDSLEDVVLVMAGSIFLAGQLSLTTLTHVILNTTRMCRPFDMYVDVGSVRRLLPVNEIFSSYHEATNAGNPRKQGSSHLNTLKTRKLRETKTRLKEKTIQSRESEPNFMIPNQALIGSDEETVGT